MTVRVIVTKASVWQFDEAAMEFRRSPRVEGNGHLAVAYHEGWAPYTALEEFAYEGGDVTGFVISTPSSPTGTLVSAYWSSDQWSLD